MDPKLKEDLRDKDGIMPENEAFKDAQMNGEAESKVLVAIKKQRNISSLDGLDFSLLREIKLL